MTTATKPVSKSKIDITGESYMSPKMIRFFSALLTAELLIQRAKLPSVLPDEVEVTSDVNDQASRIQERLEEASAADRAYARIRDLEAALKRIATGEYGYCEESGEEIGVARLLANPVARLTVEAQEHAEFINRNKTR